MLSDTHGLLRPEAVGFLAGCDYLIHAGDIGTPQILDALAALAPLTTVRGNNDQAAWAAQIRTSELIRLGGTFVYVVHDSADASPPAQARVVITGHTHKPKIERRGDVLWVNPGSCGPRRFKLPVCVGEILIEDRHVSARTVELLASTY